MNCKHRWVAKTGKRLRNKGNISIIWKKQANERSEKGIENKQTNKLMQVLESEHLSYGEGHTLILLEKELHGHKWWKTAWTSVSECHWKAEKEQENRAKVDWSWVLSGIFWVGFFVCFVVLFVFWVFLHRVYVSWTFFEFFWFRFWYLEISWKK